jgi:3-phosphoshikimate 1-carboxyvinyltransferase
MSAEPTSAPLPDALEIAPLDRPPTAAVSVPGSKSITNRALVLAALASRNRWVKLVNVLRSEDTEVMLAALERLGFRPGIDWSEATVTFPARWGGALIPATAADLFVANSGTTMRFLTAMLSIGQGRYRLDGVPRMRQRPIGDLLEALRGAGVKAVSEAGNGCPPVVIEADEFPGGTLRIKGDVSSQFLSGLLLAAPFAQGDVAIELTGPLVSEPYVWMTLRLLDQWGLRVDVPGPGSFRVPAPQQLPPLASVFRYPIEPDASAASYFFAAAAITGGRVTLPGLSMQSLQGDVHFVDVLQHMGCKVQRKPDAITVSGGPLRGIDVDMNAISDTVMTLAAVACFAAGPTTVRNVGHIRHKETDRLAALATELRRLGATVEERADGLTITPRPLHGAAIETYDDHRMAMSLALVGLKVPGVVIRNPGCVAKTYPGFFADLEKLRSS